MLDCFAKLKTNANANIWNQNNHKYWKKYLMHGRFIKYYTLYSMKQLIKWLCIIYYQYYLN